MPSTWESIAARKKQEQAARIPKDWLLPAHIDVFHNNALEVPASCGLLSEHEIQITNHDATALVEELAAGRLKSVDVVTAFCKRAAIAQQLTNCLTEMFFETAIEHAKSLDEYYAKNGKPRGPFHGLPISLKDSFRIKGLDASIGIASLCCKPCTTNSPLVDLLVEAGAVLYCKTNVPQTLMALDSHNNIFGRVINPANRHLTPGGSSGGEGALVAMRGSPLGVGTDVGGSIRIPAACNGLYGVKPSHGRVPYANQENGSLPGGSRLGIESTAGPIARSLRDCELFLRVVGDSAPWTLDPDVVPQTWDLQLSRSSTLFSAMPTPLRVGIVRTDGIATPLPPIARLMDQVAETLRGFKTSQAIEVVDMDITPLISQCLKVANGIFSIDGANHVFNLLEETGEPLSPWLQGRLARRSAKSLDEIRGLQARKTELQTKFLDIWKESGGYWKNGGQGVGYLDVIICPVAPHPIVPVDRWNTVSYTSSFNLLDYPCGVLPVRQFSLADREGDVPASKPLNGWDKTNRELWTRVDKNVYLDSPLSVQVVAPKLQERRLVQSMKVLQEALRPLGEGAVSRQCKL